MADKNLDDDPRYEYLCEYLTKTMRLKSDKWPKMIGNEEYRILLQEFLNNPKVKTIIFTINNAGLLQPMLTYPPNAKSKSVYFIKKKEEVATVQNLPGLCIFGDMAPNPVEELSVLVEELFVPLLSNPDNQMGWPKCVADDVMKHIHTFRGTVYQIKGKMTGQTLLPMPVGIEKVYQEVQNLIESQGKMVNLQLKTAIEGAVIKWAHQINDVLVETTEVFFKDNNHPVPSAEIIFWNQRLKNLESIYDQLRDPRVKKMAIVLEITESSYTHTYRTFFRNVVAAVTEARDICLYLNPLLKMFDLYESTDFNVSTFHMEPILHCICILWANSRYYCLSQRIITLLKMFGNTIVEQCIKYLDPGSVFQGDQENTRGNLIMCHEKLIGFLKTFEEYRKRLPTYFKEGVEPKPWSFNANIPFQRVIDFVERLGKLIDFLGTVIDFQKLDRIELAGIKGRNLGFKVGEIMNEFQTTWLIFNTAVYDPLDPDVPNFLQDYEKFQIIAYDFDRRLASIFIQAFDECCNLESLFKLCNIMGSLAKRPEIKKQVEPKFKKILQYFDEELKTVKQIYDETLLEHQKTGYYKVDRFWAQVSGTLCWILKMKGRVDYPIEPMKLLEYPILDSPEAQYLIEKHDKMMELLQKLETQILDGWTKSAPEQIDRCLKKPMLLRSKEDQMLILNFDPFLVCSLREIRYLNAIGPFQLPTLLVAFYDRVEQLFSFVQNLNQLINWYNQIRKKSRIVEFNLFEDEIILIDLLVNCGISFLNWNSPESEVFILKCRYLIKKLYERVTEAQENASLIYQLIFQWSNEPLYERTVPRQLLGLDDRIHRVKQRCDNIVQVGQDIHELVTINYHLLLDIPLPEHLAGTTEEEEAAANEAAEGEEEEEQETGTVQRRIRRRKRIEEPINPLLAGVLDPPRVIPTIEPKKDVPKPKKKLTKEEKEKLKQEREKERERQRQLDLLPPVPPESFTFSPVIPPRSPEFLLEQRKIRWEAYLEYIDQVVTAGILSSIACSIGYLIDETDPNVKDHQPLFEVALELQEPNLVFVPSLGEDSAFMDLILTIEEEIFGVGKLVPRVASHKEWPDYEYEAKGCVDLHDMREELIVRTKMVMFDALRYSENFQEYSYLWLDDKQECLSIFLRYGRMLTKEEQEVVAYMGDVTALGLPDKPPVTNDFKQIIDKYNNLYKELDAKLDTKKIFQYWFQVDCKPFKNALLNTICKWANLFKNHLYNYVLDSISELEEFIIESDAVLSVPVQDDDYEALIKVMAILKKIRDRQFETDEMFTPLWETIELLKTYEVEFTEETYLQLQELPEKWTGLKKLATAVKQLIAPLVAKQVNIIRKRIMLFDLRQNLYKEAFRKLPFYTYGCKNIYEVLDAVNNEIMSMEAFRDKITKQAELFEVNVPEFLTLIQVRKDLKTVKILWDYVNIIEAWFAEWKATSWKHIDIEGVDFECKRFGKELRGLDKDVRTWNVYMTTEANLKNMMTSLRAVTELQNPAIRDRHWIQLMQATKKRGNKISVKFVMTNDTTLADLINLNLHHFEEEVKTIVDKSVKEMAMEKTLKELEITWKNMEFDKQVHARTNTTIIATSEEMIEVLENDQNQLQNMMSSKFIDYFYNEVSNWQNKLSNADQVIAVWMEVQRSWQHLESIFIGSEDIRSQLPEDSKRFEGIDRTFKNLQSNMVKDLNVVRSTNKPGLIPQLEELQRQLVMCEKALSDYLETKRLIYPRFYFVSSADLLDILSNGNQPELVGRHLTKLYDSLGKLKFSAGSKNARGMFAKDGEYVEFKGACDCSGKVEIWLNRVTDAMRRTLRIYFSNGVVAYDEMPRDQFLFAFPAQVALCGTQIWWTTEVNIAFERLEEGYENALKDYNRKQIHQLSILITLLCGDLTRGDRQKIMTVCTIDVHSRDVIAKMIVQKVESSTAFQWQSQLRHRWDFKVKDCFGNICDAQFRYDYEYLGCTPRLVITPLTDRCYITLTQSLHLIMGGAPAGPAGTGKTETTKDLGRALGIMVYVFNCSEQMDYKSCGNIYKGLAQTGAWGCFDEFNRISVEVLSVVAVQVKSIQDAIKTKKQRFNFMGEIINLISTVGIFITMNPGYAGRTELPENLKALFRPCAMVVPDFELICEIMLVAEGFQEARLLARKFITLYTLCKELLSKQDHYDWGLRAIKSVLVVAGALKRGDRLRPEDQVLMRALRDFNIPKIVTDDLPVFMGLIGDLFPALDVPRKRDLDFEKAIKGAALDLKLQPEDNFILKCVQLEELFDVRHSVFIIGFAGTGKSQVWKTLNRTYANQKRKPWYNDLNPKAVTNDELFGIINPATREWKDGLFSVIMRDQANMSGDGPKWIVLDGDIDPMWIESLNTLMDDNKVLTLASNERIALTPSMRLLFEISNLRTATPATVSRAGILYINPQDLGWNPFVASWLDTRTNQSEVAQLNVLFDKYVPPCLEALKTKFKKITPLPEINHIQFLCYLLECLLIPANVPNDCPKEWYEIYFAWACVWAFGSSMFQDQLVDWRNEFNKWWINEFKVVRFPPAGTVFHYFIDQETKKFLPWTEKVVSYEFDPDIPLQSALVNTSETTRLRYFMDILTAIKVPVMFVGNAGSGKSVIVADKMNNLTEQYAVTNVPFNFYTTSEMLQKVLEKPLEKKAGRNYGPPGNKSMIYFIDDMNMPEVDTYGTVQPHTLIRQHIDYSHWYDRIKLSLKEIHNCQYVSCMNPTAGSFTIDPRLQRHFAVFAVSLPSGDALYSIYEKILTGHLTYPASKFNPALLKIVASLVNVALQGILFSTPECLPGPNSLIKLWLHEANRVYCDKLVDEKDIKTFQALILETVRKEGIGESKYLPVDSWKTMNRLLEEGLSQYNDLVAALNLVLFEDAMHHICRINRILEAPRGNALLVGVGGSGKQSLSRLASFISSLEVFQLQLRKGYSLSDLKADVAVQYIKAGIKGMGTVFLMTDAQVSDEKFLVVINDCLASGEIPELFGDDEVDNIVNAIRVEVKGAGIVDTKENCWKFYIDKVRRLLKVVLCFSPVGSTLRVRSRKFPAVVNCTAIDWFHEWPHEALISVSYRFLSELEALPEHLRKSVAKFMANTHTSVNLMSQVYLTNEKRYNYTTPKSFLEQISLYFKLLNEKSRENLDRIEKLENGLTKLVSTSQQVDGLKEILAVQEVVLAEKNAAADALITVVGAESDKVAKEKAIAAEEEEKVRAIEEDVSAKQKVCEEDLAKAEPALLAAQAALDTLDKTNLTEYKSFGTPPPGTDEVAAAVMVLFAPKGKIPRIQDRNWKNCKVMMAKVDSFLDQLKNYDKENMQPEAVKAVQFYLDKPDFDPERIKTKSQAAAGLCSWVINIIKFYEVFVFVEPKRQALAKANKDLQDARDKLKFLKEKLADLEEKLGKLTAEFDAAMNAKMKCQAEADATALTINLANRLVGGLASENVRWKQSVANLKAIGITLPGDVLLVTAFISYVGCFGKKYRIDLMEKNWIPFIKSVQPPIPVMDEADPLSLLIDDAQIATWNNEGLPNDKMSVENATILVNSTRWPLMIDPQLQGIKWIKHKYGDDLKVVRLGQKSYLDVIEYSISQGFTVLIEYIGETVDAVLDPLLGRALIRKGRAIKMGDKEVDFNPNFRLILQTKLANPHYKPEMQAQTTLINFTVTKDGLEDQLLGGVVKAERPDLEELKTELTQQQNTFKITLKFLEDDLLFRLSSAGDDILSDVTLVENLEKTKRTAADISVKVAEAKVTSVKIDEAREQYRPVAARASLLYFVLNDLCKVNPMYQFSLKAFTIVFHKALATTEEAPNLKQRVANLIECVTYNVFMYTNRALFEADKLIFKAQMTIQILIAAKEAEPEVLDFLLRFPANPNVTSPVDFLTNIAWGGVKTLSNLSEFKNLDKDIEGSAKRWKKFAESEKPEREKLPQEWKNKTALQRLCIMRCLRPDRMTYAVGTFIEEKMGLRYAEARTVEFARSYEESSSTTPVFFILSPGVDPLKDVEKLGKRLGFTMDKRNFHNVSLGQGQEVVAEEAMEVASREGHWVILQNVHLVKNWLPTLEKKMEQCMDGAHDHYRLFISAEPAACAEYHIMPQGILESAIKITNEPPTGMLANIHKALDNFNQETLESCSKEAEFKAILFALCYFHAVVAERRKFGAQGWNRVYPFNAGDLTISISVLYNYLENNSKIPWEDLRYLFGEIMYGGHITDDWDRRLCRTYLEEFMKPELIDGELFFAPGFLAPPNSDFVGYHNYIDDALPSESPNLYGLHLNAEIGFLTTLSENMFRTIFEMQPRDAGAGDGATMSKEDKLKTILDDLLDKAPDEFNLPEIMAKVEDKTPYILVAFQELERMNILFREIKRSLKELDLGLKGELTISTDMEVLMGTLFMDQIPAAWAKRAYPSMLPLGGWYADLIIRLKELEAWAQDFNLPAAVWLAGFFNPQSFLTAIMQSTARKNEWPLDKMCLHCEVTKKSREEFTGPPREGANICGLFMEGARWDTSTGGIVESKVKELFPIMPVIYIKAITQDKQDLRGMYECPVYKTRQRGPTYVWTFNLKTKEKPARWTLAGVAILLGV
ncbi:hypothetical protein RUM43_013303 [Polyplax serrata]|uniref:Dynein beta chain, ciliary-like n=1 Tax=Polyplax serrata TaxID=468196 RepID=A0AAN8RY84_POLSC